MQAARTYETICPGKKAGFTLIELMIVVAILGLLAAIAIPSFNIYIRKSRAAEATGQLRGIFTLLAAYYHPDRQETAGMGGAVNAACVVDTTHNDVTPGPTKVQGDYTSASWRAIDFEIGYSYFRYEIQTQGGGSRCSVSANTAPLYYLRAYADQDGDGTRSLTELTLASDRSNYLYHSRGFYVVNESE
jgi:prepilin-type N-terminal cleavage/methylation domain-containing protein